MDSIAGASGPAQGSGARADVERAPTVLQLVPTLEAGGVERGTIDVAAALTAAGGTALVASAGGRMEPALARAGGRLIRMEIGAKAPWAIRRNARRLAEIVTAEGVDVIHARSRAPAWAGWLAARATGAAFVTTWHGTYRENLPLKRLYNGVMAKGRPVIAVSEFIAEHVRARHPSAEIVTVPRGVDLDRFSPETVSGARTAALAERWGLVESPRPVVLLPGRLTRWKGQAVFVEAAGRLRELRDAEDFLFLMVGGETGSAFGRELAGSIRRSGLEGCVAMVGHCDDMPAALKLASVVVSASLEPEAFGRVAAEGSAMGRPVVATDHGGARETVADGATGFLVPPGDAAALAAGVQRALSLDESGLAHMASAGRGRVRQRFSLEAMTGATLEIWRRAAETARRG
jgi:glycosyltransferase involved in cell wall biosynthesis